MLWIKKNTTLPEEMKFEDLHLPGTPNYFLLLPAGFGNSITRLPSPVFDYPVDQLETAWNHMIKYQHRARFRSFSKIKKRYHYSTRSLVLRLPGYLIVEFVAVNEMQSSLAMYSYDIYGSNDFGMNRLFVFRLLIALRKQLLKSA